MQPAARDACVLDDPPSSGELSKRAIHSPTLRVSCFGGFRVAGRGEWERGPAQKRARDVIQYLVLHRHAAVSRDRLTESLWPGDASDVLAHRLHVAVSAARTFLRRLLGGFNAIHCSDEGYWWDPTLRIVCDAGTFSTLFRDGSQRAMQNAVAIYTGELLEGQSGDWVHPERVKYACMYASMVERLANAAFAAGDFEAALQFGLALLGVDRAHEGAARLVIRCMAGLGRRGQALAEYDSLRAYLRKHLGVEPMPETTALIGSIVQPGTPASRAGIR